MKVAIIGTGRVGSATAFCLADDERINELVLVNRTRSKADGLKMDLMGTFPSRGNIIHVGNLQDASNSDIIVITGGATYPPEGNPPLKENQEYIKEIFTQCKPKKSSIVILIGSPPDKLALTALVDSKLLANQVIGFGGQLDINRLKYLIWNEQKKFPNETQAYFIGEHGPRGIPIIRTNVCDKTGISEQTRFYYRLFLSKHESSVYGTASELANLVRALMGNNEHILHVSYYEEKYKRFIVWPCTVNERGVTGQVPLELMADEKKAFEWVVSKG